MKKMFTGDLSLLTLMLSLPDNSEPIFTASDFGDDGKFLHKVYIKAPYEKKRCEGVSYASKVCSEDRKAKRKKNKDKKKSRKKNR